MSGAPQVIDNASNLVDPAVSGMAIAKGMDNIMSSIPRTGEGSEYRNFFASFMNPRRNDEMSGMHAALAKSVEGPNAVARAFRANARQFQTVSSTGRAKALPSVSELSRSGEFGEIAKAVLDVGTLTNFASVTGGQSLGYVSLDTQIARGTVRPGSFTLYQALKKTAAFQVVDYWAYLDDTGGAIPGAAFSGFANVATGTLTTNVGRYSLQNVNLKLMLDGRAMTIALAAQNSFADIPTQESANAALTILSTANWASYWGNPTIFPNQFAGLDSLIPAGNSVDFQVYYNSVGMREGWSTSQALYNCIYEQTARILSFNTFGQITHAFMSPATNASLQGLVTTTLNNILTTLSPEQTRSPGIVINGDLQGMRTRFGEIQFVLDMFITARISPAAATVRADGSTPATLTAPSPPLTVVAAATAVTGTTGISGWTATYTPTGTAGSYVYAVAGLDINTVESVLAYSAPVTTVAAGGAVTLTITPAAANDAAAMRIYRSGTGYAKLTTANTPYSFRYIGTVATTGTAAVTFVDYNTTIPGSETIFLLDLAEEDNALDWRFLLPLTKIELFAQNLYMPWAVAMIGALRVKVPKFHGKITNYSPDEVGWNPTSPNN